MTAAKKTRKRSQSSKHALYRYVRYCEAFDRVETASRHEYYLEAIAIIDSLLTDRLGSRLRHLNEKYEVKKGEVDANWPSGILCKKLVGPKDEAGPPKKGIEDDNDFRITIKKIQSWVDGRNEALHGIAKVYSDEKPRSLRCVLEEDHKPLVEEGIKLLREFDKLDTASREKVIQRKEPATSPNAFFPEKRNRDRRLLQQTISHSSRETKARWMGHPVQDGT